MLSHSASVILCVVFFIDNVRPLKLTELQVPTQVPLGIRPVLYCRWTLSPSDMLYSVKWYKDGKEFFRHVPRDSEPVRIFLLPGVDVKKFNSSGCKLILAPAVVATSGRYRCEVSGERPRFHTVSEYADMLVVDLPSDGLSILGYKPSYRVGDQVNVNCSSSHVQTGMKLAWYVNGENASSPTVPGLVYVEDNTSDILGMKFVVVESLVDNWKIQCVAAIGSILWRSIEKTVTVTKNVHDTQNPDIRVLKYNTEWAYPTNTRSGSERIKLQHYLIASSFLFSSYLYLRSSALRIQLSLNLK